MHKLIVIPIAFGLWCLFVANNPNVEFMSKSYIFGILSSSILGIGMTLALESIIQTIERIGAPGKPKPERNTQGRDKPALNRR